MRIPEKDYINLLERIHPIILEKGLKAATMDCVAQRLQISKRTLYEIFENKDDMIQKVLEHNAENKRIVIEEILHSSSNSIEAFIRILSIHRDDLQTTNVAFFKDMDSLPEKFRMKHASRHSKHSNEVMALIQSGISDGLFREDLNFPILLKMLEIQSEAIKRMEELFPPEITLLEVSDTILIGFLRSISTAKGHEMLDRLIPVYFSKNKFLSSSSHE